MFKRMLLASVAVLALSVPAWAGIILNPSYEGEPPPQGFMVTVINGTVYFIEIPQN
jgi:hypothetical protein